MKQEELVLKLKMLGDVKDLQHNIDQVQKWLGNLGKNSNNSQSFIKLTQQTHELNEEVKQYVELLNKTKKSAGDLTKLENLTEKITRHYKDLGEAAQRVNLSDFADKIDSAKLQEFAKRIQEADAKLSSFKTDRLEELNKLFADNKNFAGKGLLKEISDAAKSKDFDTLEKKFGSLTKNIGKFGGFDEKGVAQSGTKAFFATQILDVLKQLYGPLDQVNEKTKNIRQQVDLLEQGMNREKTAIMENAEAMQQESAAAMQNVDASNKLLTSLNQVAAEELKAAQQAEQFRQRLLYLVSAANGLQIVRRAFQQTYQAVKELDDVMTQMAVVTTKSVGDYWKELPEYTERAYELGAAIKDVYASMTLYYQQGLNTQQATALSNATMKMARIAGLQAAEATDRMTAAMRGFNMALNETNADNVADVYSALAATSAADVDEISTAMTKVASIAHSANMEFETTSALLTAIIETTRESAETAGTALKTVIARFSEVKKLYSTGELVGNDEEGEEIDVNNISKALRTAGINLNEYLTGTKGLDDIFMELSKKWDSLDNITQRYIATMAAGSRQQSRFIAMMQNYSRNVELVNTAQNAAGAATEQFNKTLESLDAKLNQLKTQWQSYTTTIFNSNLIKGVVDTFTILLKVVNEVTGHNGFLKIGAGVLIFKQLHNVVNQTIQPLSSLMINLKGMNKIAAFKTFGEDLKVSVLQTRLLTAQTRSWFSIQELIAQKQSLSVDNLKNIRYITELIKDSHLTSLSIYELQNKYNLNALEAEKASAVLRNEELIDEQKALFLAQYQVELERIKNSLQATGTVMSEEEVAIEARKVAYAKIQNGLSAKNLTIRIAEWAVKKLGIGADEKEAFITEFINAKLADKLRILTSIKVVQWGIYAAIAAAAIALTGWIIYANSAAKAEKDWNKQNEKLAEKKTELQGIADELTEITERLEELRSKKTTVGLTLEESRELQDLETQQITVKAKAQQAEIEFDNSHAEVSKLAKKWFDKQDFTRGKREREDQYGFVELYDFIPSYNTLVSAWEKFASMNHKAQQEVLDSEQGKNWIKESAAQGIIDYAEAYKYLTNGDLEQDVLALATLETNKYNEALQALADTLGVDTAWIESYANSLKTVDKQYSYTTANINSKIAKFKEEADKYNDVFQEIVDNGRASASTIQKWSDSVSGANKTSWEYSHLLDALAYGSLPEIIEAQNAYISSTEEFHSLILALTPDNRKWIEDNLRAIGITNAEAVAEHYLSMTEEERAEALNRATSELAIKTFKEEYATAVGTSFANMTEQQISSLNNLARSAGIATNAVAKLAQAYSLVNRLKNGGYVSTAEIIETVGQDFYDAAVSAQTSTYKENLEGKNWLGRLWAQAMNPFEVDYSTILDDWITQQQNDIEYQLEDAERNFEVPVVQWSPGGGGSSSSSGGGGSSAADQWENDYDRLYNLLEKIEDEQRNLNQLQEDYNDLLKQAGKHDELVENLKQQEESLKRQEEYYSKLKQYRTQELLQAAARYSGLSEYVTVQNGVVQIDWENIDAIDNSNLFDAVKAAEEDYQRILDSLKEAQDKLNTIDDDLIKLRESWRKDIIDFKNRIKEALIKQAQDRIDALENTNKAIDDANKSLLDNINNAISEERTQRERAEQEQTLADQRRQLAYLMQDTTGANELAIKELQKQIAEGEQDYTDQLIDDKINELEKQNDEAAAAREKQIEIMQDQLDWFSENGGFWEQVNNLIGNGDDLLPDKEALFELFKNFDNFNGMSAEEQEQFQETLLHDIENVSAEMGAYGDEIPNPDVETGINDNGNSYIENGGGNGGATTGGTGSLSLDNGMMEAVAAATWAKYTQGKDYGWGEGRDRWDKYDTIFGPGASDKIQHYIDNGGGRSASQYGDWSSYSYNALLKLKRGYKTGGLADFTGPAWLDGSKAHPELVLSAKDSENFIQLKDVLAHMYGNTGTPTQSFGDSYYTFQIQVDQLSSDYDVDQVIERIQKRIEDSARYRNVNAINLMR